MNEDLAGPIPLYAYILLAFSIWMLVDAVRRRAPFYWYFVIVLLPLGALIYFVFVKLQDYRSSGENGASASRPSGSPSIPVISFASGTPNLDRADRLEEAERYDEAEPLYHRALELDSKNKQALHGIGRCLLGRKQARQALPYFEQLLDLERDYRNFSAALDYTDALWATGQKHDALEVLERLAELSGRINHRLALGHYLAEDGQLERAKAEIRRAIDQALTSTEAQQPRIRQWIERGQSMLRELEETTSPSSPHLN